MSAAGVPLEHLAGVLGHDSTRMAALVYRHVLAPTVEAGAAPMPAPLSGDAGKPNGGIGSPNGSLARQAPPPSTPSTVEALDFPGGDDGTRTHDPLLAKQVL